jgi:hypothetical protein
MIAKERLRIAHRVSSWEVDDSVCVPDGGD